LILALLLFRFNRIKVNIGAYGAMNRTFFQEIGAYDDGMLLWGGENIDLSIRVRDVSELLIGLLAILQMC
jgi:hypothetical protein